MGERSCFIVMSNPGKYRDILRALALGDADTADRLHAELDDAADHSDLVAAAFCIVVEQRFKEDSSPEAISRFMAETRSSFANAQPPLKILAAEAMVRAALRPEEADLLDEVDPSDHVRTQLPLIRKIVAESPDLQACIDDVLDDAEKIAAHWASQAAE